MISRVASIWRHPIKAHGRERLERVRLSPGTTMPGDRIWAVAHEASKAASGAWSPCVNFTRGAKAPQLMAVTAETLEDGQITVRHPDLPDLTFDPDTDGAAFVDWTRPLIPADRAAPAHLIRAGTDGMTDSDFPTISIVGLGSHAAVERQVGHALSTERWRANLIFDELSEWAEFDWIGRTLRIGEVELKVRERITRCLATAANPATGIRDADTLGALEAGWGHRDFGVYAVVTRGGEIAEGDEVRL
ncbi:MOSC domain-containing protein [Roseitranquillus sediminis]|uniref:MOSC domain-containing protein n=1 Tax=Roseitranquillus sediminis TaxID=2809051 RepID=UPI001D0C03A4|nr:MOSC N-terminal beta barrel domain-containing protein [Roseitranquillus sediminis]MBM9596433.1 MOSC domain-containing protein [Roseitranquillus sediminis]